MCCQYQNLTPGFEATKPLWMLRPYRHLLPQTYLQWNILALQLFNGCCSGEGSEYLPTKVAVPGSMTSIDFFEFQFPQHSPWTTRFSICIYIKYTLLRPYISFFSSSSACKLHKFNRKSFSVLPLSESVGTKHQCKIAALRFKWNWTKSPSCCFDNSLKSSFPYSWKASAKVHSFIHLGSIISQSCYLWEECGASNKYRSWFRSKRNRYRPKFFLPPG